MSSALGSYHLEKVVWANLNFLTKAQKIQVKKQGGRKPNLYYCCERSLDEIPLNETSPKPHTSSAVIKAIGERITQFALKIEQSKNILRMYSEFEKESVFASELEIIRQRSAAIKLNQEILVSMVEECKAWIENS